MITSEVDTDTTTTLSSPVIEGKQFKMKVLMATSLDSRHGMENIVDGRINTFWISTGLFPQEIVIALSSSVLLKTVTLTTMKVSHVILESSNTNIKEFQPLNSQEIQDGTIQTTSFSIPPDTKAKYLKFIFKKGYADFITVHKLNVTGDPIQEPIKERVVKSKTKSEHKSSEESKDKILVRQNIDSSSNIKINKTSSNSSSLADINNTSGLTPKHSKKTVIEDDNNLTDIATELQSHTSNSTSRRESRKLSKISSHNTDGSSEEKAKENL
ncbi:hypothetical protein PIROE2DRAFT_6719 [Piromyces sp. E2]|nr:hypothetical protein PIROE2DRAFT_6719 [Piromyces sp. E2]|eukprot:OUM66106.1 hypothetical protein PIROE2DRAFT_6719 [Piromyces sp. E2]